MMNLQEHPSYSGVLLEYFIDQLAEYIVLDADIPMCSLCVRGSCDHQVSGLTCRCGVRDWLTTHRELFSRGLPEEIQKQFCYLDALRSSNAVNMYGAAPYLEKEFPHWSQAWYKALLRLWMETFQERTEAK